LAAGASATTLFRFVSLAAVMLPVSTWIDQSTEISNFTLVAVMAWAFAPGSCRW
jgi:hypothetical protein